MLFPMMPDKMPASISDVRKLQFTVPLNWDGQRLDLVLARLTEETRSQIKVLVDERRVWVEGEVAKAGRLVKGGERLEVLPLPPVPSTVEPQDIPLDVLFEDEYLVAINKPPGMVVHPAPGQWDGTVVNALLFRWGLTEQSTTLRPGIVHRLDKDTSGVLLIAKDLRTLEQLSCAFKERKVHKTYLAVVIGHLRASSGTIELSIGRHPVNRKKMAVRRHGGREAVSQYQLIAETIGLSLLRLFPETGRTHQLRVHLAAIGHPIVGDHTYGGNLGNVRNAAPIARTFARQALHAEQIDFLHPISGAPLCIRAPYPRDFLQLLEIFRQESLTKKIESFLLTGKKGSTIIKA
jgi:23S rRNA pseudouridine1911/1915/1917 synthase